MGDTRIITCLDGPCKGEEHIVKVPFDVPAAFIKGHWYEVDGDYGWHSDHCRCGGET
jgi:hypothetical protein